MKELAILLQKVKALDDISFLKDNLNEKEVEKACVNYLKSLNYKVVEKPIFYKVKSIDDLVNRFYSLLEYHHTDVCSFTVNKEKDKMFLNNFVKERQLILDVSYDLALQDTAMIIQGLFSYEEELGLTIPLGVWVFASSKYRWIIDKVVFLLNLEKSSLNDVIVERLVELDEMNSKEYTGFDFEHLRRIHG